jgi:hypothetical protein
MSFDPNFREMTNIAAVSGEVSLFRAVIARAMNDALNGRGIRARQGAGGVDRVDKEDAESREARLHREEARMWLLSDGPDFRRICHWALLEPEAVRDAARRAIGATAVDDNRQVAA